MRVLLLGATGNLGLRMIQALLAHHHTLTVYVRNPSKLNSLISPSLYSLIDSVVVGDATNVLGVKGALRDHHIEAIVCVAGNQVLPWREFLLPKIARTVSDAAIEVGRERGVPLRAWIMSGFGIMEYPGTGWLIQDFLPKIGGDQHAATRDVVEVIPLEALRWSLLATTLMRPIRSRQGIFEPLENQIFHGLMAKAGSPPGWTQSWLGSIPIIGPYLNVWPTLIINYSLILEHVADFLAEDLEKGSDEWVGKKVGLKEGSVK